uniref:SEA domain-containing protein n=1 Tax=Tetranychus urticae TaxID=32264 RepID=T1L436_TETUR
MYLICFYSIWVKVRMISFILFWVSWWATLVGSTVIIFYAPKCPAQPDLASTVAGSITTLVTMMDNSTNALVQLSMHSLQLSLQYLRNLRFNSQLSRAKSAPFNNR